MHVWPNHPTSCPPSTDPSVPFSKQNIFTQLLCPSPHALPLSDSATPAVTLVPLYMSTSAMVSNSRCWTLPLSRWMPSMLQMTNMERKNTPYEIKHRNHKLPVFISVSRLNSVHSSSHRPWTCPYSSQFSEYSQGSDEYSKHLMCPNMMCISPSFKSSLVLMLSLLSWLHLLMVCNAQQYRFFDYCRWWIRNITHYLNHWCLINQRARPTIFVLLIVLEGAQSHPANLISVAQ